MGTTTMRRRIGPAAALLAVAVAALALGACSLIKDDSYEAHASDIVNTHMKQVERLSDDAGPDITRCNTGAMDACDVVISDLSKMADELHAAAGELGQLTPSAKAASWHHDYLALLADGESAIRRIVSDWNDGDVDRMTSDLSSFDDITTREDQLVSYFNDELR
jgi:hypothetical protein